MLNKKTVNINKIEAIKYDFYFKEEVDLDMIG